MVTMTPKFIGIAVLIVLILIAAGVSLSGVLKAPLSYGGSNRAVCVPSSYFTCQNATFTSSGNLSFTTTSFFFNSTLHNVKLACLTSSLMNPGQFNNSIIYTPLDLVSNAQSNNITQNEQITINIKCYGGPGVRNNADFILIGWSLYPGPVNYTTNRWNGGTEVAVFEEG
jgi:hypothetical protein